MKHKRVERLWRKEGLRVPRKQPKRGRLWLAEGAIVRRRAERPNDVCSYDFVFERTAAGRALKHPRGRRCVHARVPRNRRCPAVPAHIRSDNGPEFAAKAVPHWLERVGVQTLFIEPGSPWRIAPSSRLTASSGTSASTVSGFDTLLEAQILSEQWRFAYNHLRPHSSLRYRPPAPSARPALRQSQLPLEVPALS